MLPGSWLASAVTRIRNVPVGDSTPSQSQTKATLFRKERANEAYLLLFGKRVGEGEHDCQSKEQYRSGREADH